MAETDSKRTIPEPRDTPHGVPEFQRRYEFLLGFLILILIALFIGTFLYQVHQSKTYCRQSLEMILADHTAHIAPFLPDESGAGGSNVAGEIPKLSNTGHYPLTGAAIFVVDGHAKRLLTVDALLKDSMDLSHLESAFMSNLSRISGLPAGKIVTFRQWWVYPVAVPERQIRLFYVLPAPSAWSLLFNGPAAPPLGLNILILILLVTTFIFMYRHFISPSRRLVFYMIARHRGVSVGSNPFRSVPWEWRPWFNALNWIFERMAALEKAVEAETFDQKIEKNLLRRFSWVFERNEVLTHQIQAKNRELKREVEKHKQTARELKRHRDHLDEMVQERTTDLVKINEQLKAAIEEARIMARNAEEANRAKSQFLANVSHEVRTPLNAVIGFTDMLIDTPLNDTQLDFARTARSSGESLLILINDILDFSKIESGELQLESIDFSPELLAYDVCELIRPKIGTKPIELVCHIDSRMPAYVKGDPIRFQQVVTNLMGNAPKFTESGEISLSIDFEEKTEDKIKIHTRVQDTGIGIPEDKQAVIFEPFHQADGSTTRKYGGTGLGLSISKQLAKLMGGEVWVESELDMGSTFHFTAWLETSNKEEHWQKSTAAIAGKQFLIVDDNQTNLYILANALKSAGMRVTDLKNGNEVVPTLERAIVAGNPFDCCIIDIHMPGMSGYDVSREIRASKKTQISKLPLVAASYLMERDPVLFAQAGFDQSLIKPVRRERLFQVLNEVVGSAATRGKGVLRISSPEAPKSYTPARILVAEDNAVNQKLIDMMLKKVGIEVVMAATGKEVVEKFIASPAAFDLIFMDIQMPEMDGFEALRVIRDSGYSDIPIVAMTAHAMKEHREECLNAGMNDYIAKPVRKPALLAVLDKFLRASE